MRKCLLAIGVVTQLWATAMIAADAEPHASPTDDVRDVWTAFASKAAAQWGDRGARAAAFLASHRPERDAEVSLDLLMENLQLAMTARDEFPWAGEVPQLLFFNDVLPYAIIDEPRDRWRKLLVPVARKLVSTCKTSSEAALALNRELFQTLNVRYSTARARANQCATETIESGMASCTGLSILLVNACRSVGIPARLAGIASWPDREGNHTWVEVWDGERWRFTGAAEFDARGLDHAWFTDAAARAIASHRQHGIWATSFAATGDHFPLPWNQNNHAIPAVDVTHRYARSIPAPEPQLTVRLWESRGGKRMAATAVLVDQDQRHQSTTHADPDDINRTATFPWPAAETCRVELTCENETRLAWINKPASASSVIELFWNQLSLSRESAVHAAQDAWQRHSAAARDMLKQELDAKTLRAGDAELRLLHHAYGERPAAGHSLWISLHGGGGAPTEVNDRQWVNQSKLYTPDEGIYVAPRAPSDTWNLWHRSEVDALLDRLIEAAIAVWDVNPDRIYLMGYSAGGDGVYQLAPRMADRFAAAAMMAGHPNDASPLGLRNLPFAIFMGGKDAAYNRNAVAQDWGQQLAALQKEDNSGYPHWVQLYPELGHWMNGNDKEALPWMARHERQMWPKRIVWRHAAVQHTRFYWLQVAAADATPGRTIIATVRGQSIDIQCNPACALEVLLSDELLDLDQPIRITMNGSIVHETRAVRSLEVIERSLSQRSDPRAIATASIKIPAPQ